MPDLIAIGQGLNAVKALTDIGKTLLGLRDSAKLLEAKVEFSQQLFTVQKALLDAQAEQATLVQTIRDLEKEIASFEAWDAEKNKYELKEVAPGALAYMLKPDARAGQPPHWLCTQCYQHRKASIMQILGGFDDYSVYKCPEFSNSFKNDGQSPKWID
jgi:hypothetical protein